MDEKEQVSKDASVATQEEKSKKNKKREKSKADYSESK